MKQNKIFMACDSTNIQKARISRNPKTGEKVNTPEKKTIHFKMSKDLLKKLNDET